MRGCVLPVADAFAAIVLNIIQSAIDVRHHCLRASMASHTLWLPTQCSLTSTTQAVTEGGREAPS